MAARATRLLPAAAAAAAATAAGGLALAQQELPLGFLGVPRLGLAVLDPPQAQSSLVKVGPVGKDGCKRPPMAEVGWVTALAADAGQRSVLSAASLCQAPGYREHLVHPLCSVYHIQYSGARAG